MRSFPIILIVDNVRSLYNVGSLFRLADAVGISMIYLCGLTGYPKVENEARPSWVAERADKAIRKSGLTGVETVNFQYFARTEEAIAAARAKGHRLVALERTEGSQDYRKVTYELPLAIVIGHETQGISDSILGLVEATVQLPMRGQGKSLNVATATAAFLYYVVDQFNSLDIS